MPDQTGPTIPIPADLVEDLASDLRLAKRELAFVLAVLIQLEMTAKADALVLARFDIIGFGERLSEKEYLAGLLGRAGVAAMRAFKALGGSRAEIKAAINERYDAAQAERLLEWFKAVPPEALPEA